MERLKYTGEDECILSEVTCFKKLTDEENLNDYQGCYLISDEARGTLIKSELLIEGFKNVWKKIEQGSMLQHHSDRVLSLIHI